MKAKKENMEECMKTEKNSIWNFYENIEKEQAGEGVVRRVLSYTDEVMVVQNHFQKGAVGALHHHPHTQITYVVSGQFEFEIGGEKKVVNPGDSMLKRDGVEHGCVCLEEGILLDIFAPMREDFVS
jgi:quercetin dioxygenase-like cupin family protein